MKFLTGTGELKAGRTAGDDEGPSSIPFKCIPSADGAFGSAGGPKSRDRPSTRSSAGDGIGLMGCTGLTVGGLVICVVPLNLGPARPGGGNTAVLGIRSGTSLGHSIWPTIRGVWRGTARGTELYCAAVFLR